MSADIVFAYKPTDKQRLFHKSTANEVLYGGAAGGGKSYSMCWDALKRCLKWPKTSAYMFRRTYPELKETLIKTMCEILPPQLGKYVDSEHKVRLINGSEILFRHIKDESVLTDYQGAQIQWLYFDELTHFTKPMYDFVKSRVRASKELGVVPCVRCASNPGSSGHAWVKAYFVDATDIGKHPAETLVEDPQTGELVKNTIEYIPATVADNPYISANYRIELALKPPKLRDALLYGKWDAFEGQAFPEFINDPKHYKDRLWTHVIEPFKIPLHWTRYVSFDHGYTHPYSFGAWAVDEEGRAYRYKELYGCKPNEPNTGVQQTPSEIANALAEWMQPEFREGIHVMGIADPAIWDRSRGTSVEEQIRSVFSGISFMKGDNTRIAGKMQVHERFKFDKNGEPMVYIFNNCTDFIRTIPSLAYDPHKPEDIDTEGEDHIYDESRYFFMSRPIAPRKGAEKKDALLPFALRD